LYDTVTTLDAKNGTSRSRDLLTPAQFSRHVHQLSAANLARVHAATSRVGNWDQMGSDSAKMLAAAHGALNVAALRRSHRRVRHRRDARHRRARGHGHGRDLLRSAPRSSARLHRFQVNAAADFPPDEPLGNFPAPPPAFQPSSPVSVVSPITCASNGNPYPYYVASDTAIFVADTVANAAEAAYSIIPMLAPVFVSESFADPAKIIAAAIAGVADLAAGALEDAQQSAEDCDLVNQTSYSDNADNSSVNGFALEQQNEQTIGAIESSVNTIHDQIHVVAQSLSDELTSEIQQALALPGTAPADVYYELPTSAGGNLDSTPVGVQAVVTNAYNAAKQAGLPVNATATSDLAAANQALAAHNYKTAWKDYQAAYQALG
jgi:hypothetical protein